MHFSIVGTIKSNKKTVNGVSKLPIVLKPAMGGDDCPSFEVEESSDRRLTLLPVGPKAANAKSLVAKKNAPANQSATGSVPKVISLQAPEFSGL